MTTGFIIIIITIISLRTSSRISVLQQGHEITKRTKVRTCRTECDRRKWLRAAANLLNYWAVFTICNNNYSKISNLSQPFLLACRKAEYMLQILQILHNKIWFNMMQHSKICSKSSIFLPILYHSVRGVALWMIPTKQGPCIRWIQTQDPQLWAKSSATKMTTYHSDV